MPFRSKTDNVFTKIFKIVRLLYTYTGHLDIKEQLNFFCF